MGGGKKKKKKKVVCRWAEDKWIAGRSRGRQGAARSQISGRHALKCVRACCGCAVAVLCGLAVNYGRAWTRVALAHHTAAPTCLPRMKSFAGAVASVAGHLLVSYGFGVSLRSARTALENTILTAVSTVVSIVYKL